jgi:hypothetical protein
MDDMTPGPTTGRAIRGALPAAAAALATLLGGCSPAFPQCRPADADGITRSIQALDVRSQTQHEQMLADTQALANEIESLVQLNAERIAEIAALTSELAALRAEVALLRRGHR